jgi:hypothetical protein
MPRHYNLTTTLTTNRNPKPNQTPNLTSNHGNIILYTAEHSGGVF